MVSFPPVSPPRLYTPPLLTHTRHMPSPSHSSRFYHNQDDALTNKHNIGIQFINLKIFPRLLCFVKAVTFSGTIAVIALFQKQSVYRRFTCSSVALTGDLTEGAPADDGNMRVLRQGRIWTAESCATEMRTEATEPKIFPFKTTEISNKNHNKSTAYKQKHIYTYEHYCI